MKFLVPFLYAASLLLAPANAQPQGGGGPPQPWKKTCTPNGTFGEGCSVLVEMRISPHSPCDGGVIEYCVKISVTCPANNPPGDPAESCSAENCEFCGDTSTAYSITCDGQCFTAKPKPHKKWSDVAIDCIDLDVSSTNQPCS